MTVFKISQIGNLQVFYYYYHYIYNTPYCLILIFTTIIRTRM